MKQTTRRDLLMLAPMCSSEVMNFFALLHIHIQSLSENLRNLLSDIHPYTNMTLAQYKNTLSLL